MPAAAGIPQPVGAAEQIATESFLGWVQDVLDWGRTNAQRAKIAQVSACG